MTPDEAWRSYQAGLSRSYRGGVFEDEASASEKDLAGWSPSAVAFANGRTPGASCGVKVEIAPLRDTTLTLHSGRYNRAQERSATPDGGGQGQVPRRQDHAGARA
jgi:hypothetical protein